MPQIYMSTSLKPIITNDLEDFAVSGAVEGAVADGFGDVTRFDIDGAIKVSDGARYAKDAVERAG